MSSWDQTFDVVVLGSGAAGLCGALAAAAGGRSVVVLEKSEVWGGSAAMSAGALWVPANAKSAAVGIDDSEDDAMRYLRTVTEGAVAEDRLLAFVRGANRMVEFLERDTCFRVEPVQEYPDYNSDVDGAKLGGRVLEPVPDDGSALGEDFATLHPCYPGELIFDRFMMTIPQARALLLPGLKPKLGLVTGLVKFVRRRKVRRALGGRDPYLTMGQALTSRLRRSLNQHGVPLWLESPVTSLVVEDGRVVGVEIERGGRTERIRATAGVLVGTGGFERDDAMRKRYNRQPAQAAWSVGHVGNTGDGIRLGETVGAALDEDLMKEAWWAPAVVPPGEPTAWVLVIEKSLPRSFFVDRTGRRFVNEAANYTDVGRAMYDEDARTGEAVPAWWIFDAAYRRKFPVGPIKPGMMMPDKKLPEAQQPGQGWLHRADTLEELARMIGVDAGTLRSTTERFNEHARNGVDPDFGRGATANDLHYSDLSVKPNPSLGPVEKAPFYAVPVVPGDLGTKSGMITDCAGRVLDAAGAPIPGLYAAGNVTSSVMGRSYPGAGGTLAPAMTFAFLAAEAIGIDAT